MLRPHPFCLVDAADGCHLAVFVCSENLTHGACGHAVGNAEDIDLLVLVNVAHGRLLLPLRRWRAAVWAEWKQECIPAFSAHTDVT